MLYEVAKSLSEFGWHFDHRQAGKQKTKTFLQPQPKQLAPRKLYYATFLERIRPHTSRVIHVPPRRIGKELLTENLCHAHKKSEYMDEWRPQ
jgi:hypothetical protein